MLVTDLMVRLVNLSRFTQQIIVGAIVLVTLIFTIALTYFVVSTIASQRETILQSRLVLARMDRVVAADDGKTTTISLIPSGEGSEFLIGSNNAIIQAGMQSRLNAVANAVGATVISSGAIGPVEKNSLTQLGVRANVEGPINAIYNALLQIEMGTPFLTVNEFTIRGPVSFTGLQNDITLSAQITFSGLRAPEGSKP